MYECSEIAGSPQYKFKPVYVCLASPGEATSCLRRIKHHSMKYDISDMTRREHLGKQPPCPKDPGRSALCVSKSLLLYCSNCCEADFCCGTFYTVKYGRCMMHTSLIASGNHPVFVRNQASGPKNKRMF